MSFALALVACSAAPHRVTTSSSAVGSTGSAASTTTNVAPGSSGPAYAKECRRLGGTPAALGQPGTSTTVLPVRGQLEVTPPCGPVGTVVHLRGSPCGGPVPQNTIGVSDVTVSGPGSGTLRVAGAWSLDVSVALPPTKGPFVWSDVPVLATCYYAYHGGAGSGNGASDSFQYPAVWFVVTAGPLPPG